MSKRIFILGSSSKVSESVGNILLNETDFDVLFFSGSIPSCQYPYGVTDIKNIKRLFLDYSPDIVINFAGISDIETCENNKKLAWSINANAVDNLARLSIIYNYHFITFSTDMIFDGTKGPYHEEDKPNPINYFGKSKLAAENLVISSLERYTIIRLNNVFGISSFNKTNWVDAIIDSLENEKIFEASEFEFSNPVYCEDIAFAVLKIIQKKLFGIYNLGSSDWRNKYEMAKIVAKVNGLDENLIVKSDNIPKEQCKIPAKAGLITLKASSILGIKMSSIEDSLVSYRHKKKFDNNPYNLLRRNIYEQNDDNIPF